MPTLEWIGKEIFQKMFNLHWTKKQADADAYADERKLQTIRDNPAFILIRPTTRVTRAGCTTTT